MLNETSVLGHIFPDGKVENDEIDVLFVSMVIVLKEESPYSISISFIWSFMLLFNDLLYIVFYFPISNSYKGLTFYESLLRLILPNKLFDFYG